MKSCSAMSGIFTLWGLYFNSVNVGGLGGDL